MSLSGGRLSCELISLMTDADAIGNTLVYFRS